MRGAVRDRKAPLVCGVALKKGYMKNRLIGFFKRAMGHDHGLHPLDRKIAKQYIKKRMLLLFPELRNNPAALEKAYRDLSLEPRPGTEEGDMGTYFEMVLPG